MKFYVEGFSKERLDEAKYEGGVKGKWSDQSAQKGKMLARERESAADRECKGDRGGRG